jgi:hypothetical protein
MTETASRHGRTPLAQTGKAIEALLVQGLGARPIREQLDLQERHSSVFQTAERSAGWIAVKGLGNFTPDLARLLVGQKTSKSMGNCTRLLPAFAANAVPAVPLVGTRCFLPRRKQAVELPGPGDFGRDGGVTSS